MLKFVRSQLVAAIFVASAATLLAQNAPPADLDSYVANSMKTFDVPGMAVAIVKDGKVVLTAKRETTGAPTSIRLTADRTEISADGEDIAVLRVEALDKEGRPVPTASNFIGFKVSGQGKLIGVGNGDPNCQQSDKEPHRSLFNGLAQVIVQSTKEPGEIHIEAVKEGWDGAVLTPAKLSITTKGVELRPQVAVKTQS